jgi:Alpha-kinase family/Zinc finger C-x8-C-x5-C-x3-H type (and similar)
MEEPSDYAWRDGKGTKEHVDLECMDTVLGFESRVDSLTLYEKRETSFMPSSSSSTSSGRRTSSTRPFASKTSASMKPTSSRKPTSTAGSSRPKMSKDERLAKRKQEITDLYKVIRNAERVQLCFLMDCTGSMQPWIDHVKNAVFLLNQRLLATCANGSLETACVAYTDYDVSEDRRTKVSPFSTSRTTFKAFVGSIKASGGGDPPEDIFGGLHAVARLPWKEHTTKVVIHIADAPCHGSQYHSMPDSYPDGDPGGRTLGEVLEPLFHKTNFNYYFGFIRSGNTDQMIDVFNEYLHENGQLSTIVQFNAMDPTTVVESAYMAVTESIACSVAAGADGPACRRSLRKFKLHRERFTNWDSIASSKYLVHRFDLPASVDNMLKSGYELALSKITVCYKRAPDPFAEGGLRVAYHARDVTHGKDVVFKECKYVGSRSNSLKAYFEDMETQTVAAKMAMVFNEKVDHSLQIKFAVAKVVKRLSGTTTTYYALEPLIAGEYRKFNSNSGWVADGSLGHTMQAFSHWTWWYTYGRLMVVDLQGVRTTDGIFLTDPAIHSKALLKFGKTNLGNMGMMRFMKSHTCNEVCHALDIHHSTFEDPRYPPPRVTPPMSRSPTRPKGSPARHYAGSPKEPVKGYKTVMCSHWADNGVCKRPSCRYAHGKKELRSSNSAERRPSGSFKTKICRTWEEEGICPRSNCTFAHGQGELRC